MQKRSETTERRSEPVLSSRRAGVIVLLVAILAGLTAPADATPAAVLASGAVRGSAVYRADIADRMIDVTESFEIDPGASSFEAVVPAASESVESTMRFDRRSQDPFWDVLTLHPDGTTAGALTYRFGSVDLRSAGGIAVGDSTIGFAIWPTNATAVSVILPTEYVIAENRGLFDASRSRVSTEIVYEANFPGDLQDFWFVALKGEAFQSRWVAAEGDRIQIAAWVGDDAWLDHTEEFVTKGVPELRRLIGTPWPESGLQVVQSARPTEKGYGGWYVGSRSLIEINSSMNTETLLHELSHAWFNGDTLANRWLVEGLAEEFASRALFAIEGVETEPPHPGPPPVGWNGLLEWEHPFLSSHSWAVEVYGYASAWYVLDQLTDDLDENAVRRVMIALGSNRQAYGVDSDPRTVPVNDWRRFLDLLEIKGGSTSASTTYRELVLPEELGFVLDTRAQVRRELKEFSAGDLSVVPIGIRMAMSRWEFDSARSQLTEAKAIAADLAEVDARAGKLGLEVPDDLYEDYLANRGDYRSLRSGLDQTLDVIDRFESAGFDDEEAQLFEMGRPDLLTAVEPVPPDLGRPLNQNRSDSLRDGLQLLASLLGLACVAGCTVVMLGRLRRQSGVA